MISYEIDECLDIELLRDQCKQDYNVFCLITEALVEYSKNHITAEKALKEIRKFMQIGWSKSNQEGKEIKYWITDEESGKI